MNSMPEKPTRALEDYLAIARRRRWWIILPLFLGWAAVITASWFIAPKYRSETVIIIEQQKVPEHYVVPNVAVDLQGRLQSMTQQILSRTRLQGVIEKLRLYGVGQKRADADSLVERMRQDIKIDLVPVPGRPGELSAFKISYSAPNPRLAQQVTNQLSSLFIEENLHNRQQLSQNTTEFLELQLEQARKDLARQEEHLRDFKSKYLGELPEQQQSNVQILSGLQTRLQAATEALNQANQQKLYLESWLSQYKSLRANLQAKKSSNSASPPVLYEELDRLRAQLVDLSARYTPDHPDVLRLKQQIATTEKLAQQEDADITSGKSSRSTETVSTARSMADLQSMSPMLQIEGQVKANQLEIANRQQEVRALARQIENYQDRLNLTPVREQELASITRDHEQSRTNYESLLNKKMQSEMATSLEKREEGEQFHIIDPPNVPHKPYWPDRFKFSLLGVAFGILLAFGTAALVETVDGRIYREQDLRALVASPVLARIPLFHSSEEQQKQQQWYRGLETAAASVLIIMIPTMTLFTYYRG